MLSVFAHDETNATDQTAGNNEMKRLGIMDKEGNLDGETYIHFIFLNFLLGYGKL
jgi:hypothetical protein